MVQSQRKTKEEEEKQKELERGHPRQIFNKRQFRRTGHPSRQGTVHRLSSRLVIYDCDYLYRQDSNAIGPGIGPAALPPLTTAPPQHYVVA